MTQEGKSGNQEGEGQQFECKGGVGCGVQVLHLGSGGQG